MIKEAIIVTAFCAVSVWSATAPSPATTKATHHHHHSRATLEPAAHESFKFVYEPHMHKMVVVTGHECYVFSLSDAERADVHTDAGMKALELKLLTALSTNAVVTTTKEDLDAKAAHICGRHITTFYKEATP
ncbi:uncharacterized protein LOC132728968 [Ruditapes philippinarum]|uniref:uncharacterized protein LOC132728968 n=1 Tax=Ruditapes philippinarum TaxID=129788 RepID=UPI00295A6E34|nr:uncharacterized protein LOC132728968 [Ruditapes philippinarum]